MPIISRPFTASRALSFSLLLYLHHLHRPDTVFDITEHRRRHINIKNLLFSITSSASSFTSRAAYAQMWHNPISHLNTTFLFLNRPVPNPSSFYLTAGQRIARIVKDAFALNIPDIFWYPQLYGSDARIFACVSELGVRLTVEPGSHQVAF